MMRRFVRIGGWAPNSNLAENGKTRCLRLTPRRPAGPSSAELEPDAEPASPIDRYFHRCLVRWFFFRCDHHLSGFMPERRQMQSAACCAERQSRPSRYVLQVCVGERLRAGATRVNPPLTMTVGGNLASTPEGTSMNQRVKYVVGPDGCRLELTDLPAPETKRWVIRRKAQIVAAVRGGLLSLEDACRLYRLDREEFLSWQYCIDHYGFAGLRITRVQRYATSPKRAQLLRSRTSCLIGAPSSRTTSANELYEPGKKAEACTRPG
jgi:hypothetical protein